MKRPSPAAQKNSREHEETTMSFTQIAFAVHGAVARIDHDRPEYRNAESSTLLDEMDAALAEAVKNPDVRVIVIGAARINTRIRIVVVVFRTVTIRIATAIIVAVVTRVNWRGWCTPLSASLIRCDIRCGLRRQQDTAVAANKILLPLPLHGTRSRRGAQG